MQPGLHGLVCKQAPSKTTRHQAINDVIARAVTSAGIPVTKEPVGLTRLDGKRSARNSPAVFTGRVDGPYSRVAWTSAREHGP